MRYIYIYIYILCFCITKAQIRFNTNLPLGIDTTMDIGLATIELNNKCFLAGGASNSPFSNYCGAYLVKTKSNGDTIWKKQFNFSVEGCDIFTDIKELADSNYLITGSTYDSVIQNSDVFLAKIDTNGSLLWFEKYTHTDNDQSAELKLTPDDKVIILGNSTPNPNTTYNNVLLIKTDLNGNLIWRKTFGDTYDEIYESITLIKNNSEYLLGGRHGYSSSGTDYYDMSLMRTDTAGNIIWQQQYGTPTGNETSGCALQTLDSGFVMSGTYNNSGALVKLDKNGNQKWIKNYGFPTDSYIRYVKQLPDSSFAFIVSYTYAPTNNSYTGFLNKTDKNGNLLWQRVYPGPMTIPNFFFGFNTTADKGFIMTGQYNHIGQPYQNMWLVKTDSLGCDSVTCSYLPTSIKTNDVNTSSLDIYPNPTNGSIHIVCTVELQCIEVTTIAGQVLLSEKTKDKTHRLQLQNFAEGIYFVKVVYANGMSVIKKIIKQ